MITDISPRVVDEVTLLVASKFRYASLHHAKPIFGSPTSTELAFGGYSRQMVLWTEPMDGIMTNTEALIWVGLEPPVRLSAIGLNLDAGGGGLMAYGMLETPMTSGQTSWRVNAGSLVVRIA